jgi:hypothetical protein
MTFFTTIASNLVDKLPCASKLFDIDSQALLDFHNDRYTENNKMYLKHVSETFV